MNTNFNERQGFEDLRKILSYMHNLGCEYYDSWQIAEKKLSEMKTSHEREITEQKREYTKLEQELRDNLKAWQNKFATLEENFRTELQGYRNHNGKLVNQLEMRQRDLDRLQGKLSARDKKLVKDERELATRRNELDEDRATFDADKKRINSKLEAYNALQEKMDTADAEKSTLRQKIQDLQASNAQKDKTIQELTRENNNLRGDLENYKNRVRELEYQMHYSPFRTTGDVI